MSCNVGFLLLFVGIVSADLPVITCPLKNASEFTEFFIYNTTAEYCGPTVIRTCNDGSGCVGEKYRNDTTTYQRCSPLYGKMDGRGVYHYENVDLPARVRVDKDTKYIEFVCDHNPGIEVPKVAEYWPPGYIFPKSIPPMATASCDCESDVSNPYTWRDPLYCPWAGPGTMNPEMLCDCCYDCRPFSGFPPVFAINFTNPTPHPYKIQLTLSTGKTTLCNFGTGERGDGEDLSWQLEPFATNIELAIPSTTSRVEAIPLYTADAQVCVYDPDQLNPQITLGENCSG